MCSQRDSSRNTDGFLTPGLEVCLCIVIYLFIGSTISSGKIKERGLSVKCLKFSWSDVCWDHLTEHVHVRDTGELGGQRGGVAFAPRCAACDPGPCATAPRFSRGETRSAPPTLIAPGSQRTASRILAFEPSIRLPLANACGFVASRRGGTSDTLRVRGPQQDPLRSGRSATLPKGRSASGGWSPFSRRSHVPALRLGNPSGAPPTSTGILKVIASDLYVDNDHRSVTKTQRLFLITLQAL